MTPKKIETKPTHPLKFPGPELFQKEMKQKRITTLISIPHYIYYDMIHIYIV